MGDEEHTYTDIWYTRYLNPDAEINPKLRHEVNDPKNRRTKDNLFDAEYVFPEGTSGEECTQDSGMFCGLGMFDEE